MWENSPTTDLGAPCGTSLRESLDKRTETTLLLCHLRGCENSLQAATSTAGRHDAAALSAVNWAPSLIPSSNCWPLSTKCTLSLQASSPLRLDPAFDCPGSETTCRSFGTNPINHPDANFTNKITNMTNNYHCSNTVNNRAEKHVEQYFPNCPFKPPTIKKSLNTLAFGLSSDTAESFTVSNSPDQLSMEATFLVSRETSVPQGRWENFDSSPPPTETPTSDSFFPCSSLSISSNSSVLPSQSYLVSRSQSPISAFLDSCLTPRPDEDSKETRFAFIGGLSGEGRIFTSNSNLSHSIGVALRSSSETLAAHKMLDHVHSNERTAIKCKESRVHALTKQPSDDVFGSKQRQASSEAVR